jgi:hypothetical protein
MKAYQCENCIHCKIDEIDVTYCEYGLWPGCGEPEKCKECFDPREDII